MNSRPWLLTLILACTLCGPVKTSVSAQSGNTWEATYSFEENVRRAQGNVGNMSYEIRIYRRNGELVADLDIDGWQTIERLKSDARVEGNKVSLYLRGFGEDDQTGKIKYRVGSLLLTLENSLSGGKQRLITHWGAFKPMGLANQVSGRSYFRMTETSEIGNVSGLQSSSTTAPRYFLRLSNCDDSCWANVNGGNVASSGFAQDTGWLDFTEALEDGLNEIQFTVKNEGKGIAYGFQVRKDATLVFEQVCGNVGRIGCDRNRQFPVGIAKEFTYTIRRLPTERTAGYAKWLAFLSEFRAAVNKRDRVALRSMVAIPFETQEGQLRTFDAVMRFLGPDMWQELPREIAPSAKFTFSFDNGRGRPGRCARDGIFCFELGRDGHWRLAMQTENEPA